jgi:N-acetylmuramoyl-L-alanine amidase
LIIILIYLDAGHGGKDGGASSNGIKEKDIVLTICKKIQAKLDSYQNVNVAMSRDSDVFLSLDERTIKANTMNADVLVSVHCNSSTEPSARGFESYRYTNANIGTTAFQNVMHQEIIRLIGGNISDRGKKQANFHMLRESKMKAILTENLFVSNSADADLLKNDSFLDKIAQGHVNGLEKFLGLKKIDDAPQPTPVGNKLWKVQVGAFEDKENAEELAKDLSKQGYRPFVKYE